MNKNTYNPRHDSIQAGLTLIEVVISVAVIAVIAAVSIADYGSFLRNTYLTSDAKSLISDLRTTQLKAVAGVDGNADGTADRWGICFRNSGAKYDIVYLTSTDAVSIPDPCTPSSTVFVQTTVFLQNGVSFSDPSITKSVYFEKISGVSSSASNITVTLSSGSSSSVITIEPSGSVY